MSDHPPLPALPPLPEKTFAQLNHQSGLIEIIDVFTGAVVAVQAGPEALLAETGPVRFFEMRLPDGRTVLFDKRLNPDALYAGPRQYPYSQVLADIICQALVEGTPLSKVAHLPNMPNDNVIRRWRAEHPEFEAQIRIAKKQRAEIMHDRALAEAEGATSSNVQQKKLLVDTLKWAAGVGDPDQYGNRTKISGDANAPVALVIDTGIRRPGDYQPDESQARQAAPRSVQLTPIEEKAIEVIVEKVEEQNAQEAMEAVQDD